MKSVHCVKKHLQKTHLLALEDLQLVELKAMADLATLTESIFELHLTDVDEFGRLQAGTEEEKNTFLLSNLGLEVPVGAVATEAVELLYQVILASMSGEVFLLWRGIDLSMACREPHRSHLLLMFQQHLVRTWKHWKRRSL